MNLGPNENLKAPASNSRALFLQFTRNMDQLHINYSLKDIPIPSRPQYRKQLVSKVASFASRLRWKMLFIRQPSSSKSKETFGFRSTSSPPQMTELKAFEDELFSSLISGSGILTTSSRTNCAQTKRRLIR